MTTLWFHARTAHHHLPQLQYSNEVSNIRQSVMVVNNGLQPPSLQRPTLPLYLLAGLDWVILKAGRSVDRYDSDFLPVPIVKDLGLGMADRAPEVVVANRVFCAVVGAGTVWLIFLAVRTCSGSPWAGLMAALFASISGVMTKGSIIVRPEIFVLFFVVLTLLGAVRVLKHGRRVDYLLAGLGAGLAVSSKYNAAFVLLSLFTAHLCRSREDRKHRWLLLGLGVSVVVFFLGTPYALIEPTRFYNDLSFELTHYQSGHLGRDTGDRWVYLRVLLSRERFVFWLALVGIVHGVFKWSRPALILLAFGLPYLLFISLLPVKMDRHITPIAPLVWMCAGMAVTALMVWLLRRTRERGGIISRLMLAAAILGLVRVVDVGIDQTRRVIDMLTKENGRDEAREWIAKNIPEGAVIAVESRTPWIDRDRYQVRRIPVSYSTSALWPQTPQWYADHGFEYLVSSSQVQGLYRQNPAHYRAQIAGYLKLNRICDLVESFAGRGWSIAVLRIPDSIKPAPPAPPPPWFLWAGPKDAQPIRPGQIWPVKVWLGGEEPPIHSLVGFSRISDPVQTWIAEAEAEDLLISFEDYELRRLMQEQEQE